MRYVDGKRSVVDGPFTGARELVAGFTHMQVDSKEEAIKWLKRWPVQDANGEVELQLRQIISAEDFDISPELRAEEDRLRERTQGKH